MIGRILIALGAIAIYKLCQRYIALQKNIALAEKSGLKYMVLPFSHIGGAWYIFYRLIYGIIHRIPYLRDSLKVKMAHPISHWTYLREPYAEFAKQYGQDNGLIMMVCPTGIYVSSMNAEYNAQIAARKNDFRKPIETYGVVEIFGKSMLSLEGEDWRRHRKIVGPSFSEKSNALVFKESVKQTLGMMNYWAGMEGNTEKDMKIRDVAIHAATVALHVICGAAFGLPQTWPGQDESVLGSKIVPGFNTKKLEHGHTMSFKHTLDHVGDCFVWLAVLPVWVIKALPTKLHKSIYTAYSELTAYFDELVQYKASKLELGETEEGTMDLLKPLVDHLDPDPTATTASLTAAKSSKLSKSEISGNAFIFMFAGHETAANTLTFTTVFTAMHIPSQKALHADLDRIVGTTAPTTWEYQTHMAKLFDSMVGAVQSEALRLIPPVIAIPKIMSERLDQARLTIDGKEIVLPRGTFMHFNAVGSGRSRQYWPHKVRRTGTGEEDDLDEFVPERWMRDGRYEGRAPLWGPAAAAYKGTGQENGAGEKQKVSMDEGYEAASFETSSSGSAGIFRPVKGSFVAFSEGARACPGKRFATVELTAILATIFQTHSVELDVSQWASDEEVEKMDKAERKALYDRAIQNCWDTWAKHLDIIITLKLHGGACIPVRFVKRGEERFFDCYE